MTVKDEFQEMKANDIKWYIKGYDVGKSEPLSVVQRTQIREALYRLAAECNEHDDWETASPDTVYPDGGTFQRRIDRCLSAIGLILGDTDGS